MYDQDVSDSNLQFPFHIFFAESCDAPAFILQ